MANFTLVTEQRTYAFTLATTAGVDQTAHDRLDAIRQLPAGGTTGQVLQRTSSGYGWVVASATDTVAQQAAATAQSAAGTAQARADAAYARTVAKPYPQHQIIKWDAARTGTDKYDARDTGTYLYARYYGPTDPATVGRTMTTLDEWAVTP